MILVWLEFWLDLGSGMCTCSRLVLTCVTDITSEYLKQQQKNKTKKKERKTTHTHTKSAGSIFTAIHDAWNVYRSFLIKAIIRLINLIKTKLCFKGTRLLKTCCFCSRKKKGGWGCPNKTSFKILFYNLDNKFHEWPLCFTVKKNKSFCYYQSGD